MSTPFGFRTESVWTPKASRAGALYGTERYVTPRQSQGARDVLCGVYSNQFQIVKALSVNAAEIGFGS